MSLKTSFFALTQSSNSKDSYVVIIAPALAILPIAISLSDSFLEFSELSAPEALPPYSQ